MGNIPGRDGALSKAVVLMVHNGHSVRKLMSALMRLESFAMDQTIRRYFYRGRGKHRQVIGCLLAVKDMDGIVYVGHSHCHPKDTPDKLVASYIAELQACLGLGADAIPSCIPLKDVENFIARCVKYFKVSSVSTVVWSKVRDGKVIKNVRALVSAEGIAEKKVKYLIQTKGRAIREDAMNIFSEAVIKSNARNTFKPSDIKASKISEVKGKVDIKKVVKTSSCKSCASVGNCSYAK